MCTYTMQDDTILLLGVGVAAVVLFWKPLQSIMGDVDKVSNSVTDTVHNITTDTSTTFHDITSDISTISRDATNLVTTTTDTVGSVISTTGNAANSIISATGNAGTTLINDTSAIQHQGATNILHALGVFDINRYLFPTSSATSSAGNQIYYTPAPNYTPALNYSPAPANTKTTNQPILASQNNRISNSTNITHPTKSAPHVSGSIVNPQDTIAHKMGLI